MDLKERYTSQANNLLGRLDEDYDKNIEPTHMSQKSKPFSRDELRAKGMLSIADDDEEFARYQEYMSDEDAYDEGYEEEIRAAQDNPENNGEEEMAGSRNDRAYEILDSIFFNDAQAMLDSVVKALSDDQANEIFDYIERMHQ